MTPVAQVALITIPVDRYTQLVRSERDLERVSEYLTRKLNSYSGLSHEELEMLCILGYVKEVSYDSDT